MASINLPDILRKVYGPTGVPFPGNVTPANLSTVAQSFKFPPYQWENRSRKGAPLWGTNLLGRPVFLPARLDGVELENPLISISGEKSIVETDIVDVGTVFEKVFTKPYQITILCSLIAADNQWPEDSIIQMYELWKKDAVLTLECAITDIYLQPKNNFVLLYKDVFEMQGTENLQLIQFTGRSNIDFELEIT